jgi:hypothetical protein
LFDLSAAASFNLLHAKILASFFYCFERPLSSSVYMSIILLGNTISQTAQMARRTSRELKFPQMSPGMVCCPKNSSPPEKPDESLFLLGTRPMEKEEVER